MPLATVIALLCLAVLLFFLFLWKYYDRRDFSVFENERRKTTFLCVRCETLYTHTGDPETCECPRCRFVNARLRF
ncbi:hydrogenase nickel incorporation protein HypA [Nibricoccus sp. IMCC34717]|uniref:hydrogenase nickel incorporation protein HypA n=1 Tax=Nibricoccus sp. IMCC34717 TaxID=3034021 RepID=UPI00384FCEF9